MLPSCPPRPQYRKELKAVIPASYLKPDNLHLLWLLAHMGLCAGLLILLKWNSSWWLVPGVSLLIGHSFGCMGFIAHEICHGGAIRNRRLRHFLAGVAFSPFAIGPLLWSKWHNAEHHGHTQDADLDPDRLFLLDEYKNKPVLKWLYRRSILLRNLLIFGFYCLMMSEQNLSAMMRYVRDPKLKVKDRLAILFQFLVPKLLWIVGTALMGWPVLVFGYIVPLLIANFMVISYISTNHFLNPLVDDGDVLASSLSVTLPKWLAWLDTMHSHFGAHVAHHLFPQAPSRHARKIERQIMALWPDRYHVMPFNEALKLLWNTPWIYDEDGMSLVDPHKQVTVPTLGHGLDQQQPPARKGSKRVKCKG
ncbi:MAG: fatty acid desaturase [Armatimonadetes bacterium]|nr:fatty acid desaturase [Armatimonadota bacterium]